MKITFTSLLAVTLLAIGGILGASALSAVAQTGSPWAQPSCTPPDCNAPVPLNVSTTAQVKPGTLGLSELIVTRVNIPDPINQNQVLTPQTGQVLTALDANGTIGWATMGLTGQNSVPGNIVAYSTPGSYSLPIPAGVTRVKARILGGGGGGGWGRSGGIGGGCGESHGGAGAYVEHVFTVASPTTLGILVGNGGARGVNDRPNGRSGGPSSVTYDTTEVIANGGSGGREGTVYLYNVTTAAGGTYSPNAMLGIRSSDTVSRAPLKFIGIDGDGGRVGCLGGQTESGGPGYVILEY